jgi:hypothetical protein
MLSRLSRKADLTPFVLALVATSAMAAYDVNDVRLGASEREVTQKFPNAHCRPLEWPTRAADRRCDDSRIVFGGIDASVTFYLKQDAVEGFDVRFNHGDLAAMLKFLRARYGKPALEAPTLTEVSWKDKDERARVSADPSRRRASLLVWRGAFEEEIYKVR